MPAQPFSVHVDPDDLARHELAAAVPVPSLPESGRTDADADADAKHGGGADRLAARQQSERARSSRAAGAAGGRSYAFRRS